MDFNDFLEWAQKRENLSFVSADFWAWQDAWEKAEVLLDRIEDYTTTKQFKLLMYNAALHYCIIADFDYESEGEFKTNPLYIKYKIEDKSGGIVSSASDDSSSASYHITKSLQEADFLTQDLMMTPYGKYVYQILEQLQINVVLL